MKVSWRRREGRGKRMCKECVKKGLYNIKVNKIHRQEKSETNLQLA